MSDLAQYLETSQFFAGLDKPALKKIASLAQIRKKEDGEYLVRESSTGDVFFLILKGRVDITVSLVGSPETEKIATLNEGELVGEMLLLGKSRRSANVVAKAHIEVLEWNIKTLQEFFENDAKSGYIFMRNMAASIAERLATTNQVLRNVLTIPKNSVF